MENREDIEEWKHQLYIKPERYGLGKSGSTTTSIRIVIEDIKGDIAKNQLCQNVQLRQIQHNFLTRILRKAENDLREAAK